MSRFTEKMFRNARESKRGMVTGEPHEPVRHTWGEVHERARRIAGGLAAAGIGHGDAVGVLAGFPVEIAPTAQGLWMRGARPLAVSEWPVSPPPLFSQRISSSRSGTPLPLSGICSVPSAKICGLK